MAPNPKVLKAFSAMKVLGIPTETVKPVLRNLLKLYDNNWELIEEDSYRTLADAIFECTDDKRREDKKKSAMEHDGPEPPLKKLHLEQQEDQVSSTMDNANTVLGLEEGEKPQTSIVPKLMESSQSCSKDIKIGSSSHSLPEAVSNKGKDPMSLHLATKFTKSSSERASSALLSNQTRDGAAFDHMLRKKKHKDCRGEDFVVPKRKKSVNDVPALPGTLEGSSIGNSSIKELVSPCDNKDNQADASACNPGTTSPNNFEIASSLSGDVKISLNCNSALGQTNFHAPNLDTVLKFVENKYLRSYKIVAFQFSVLKLLKDFCESYLELGTDSTDRSLIKKEASCSESTNSCGLVVTQQQATSHDRKRTSRKINDITKGTEKVRISLIDDTGNEHIPKFVYIAQNIVYQNAYIHFSLARIADDDCCSRCLGDCLSLSIPCACARDTGGEFAYTPQGLLKEEFLKACISMNREPQKHYHFYCEDCPLERAKNGIRPAPCKGHLVRKFIKECWRKCGCNMQCGNRVVQRGITCKLQVFLTNDGKGWGVRTLQDLPKGSFVCEYVGEILTNMELYERNKQSSGNERHTYPVLLDADWGSEGVLKDEDALCLDATFYGNVARAINPPSISREVHLKHTYVPFMQLAFFTKRNVDALEELTWCAMSTFNLNVLEQTSKDYGIDFDDHNHPIKAFQCCCRSAFCRDVRGKG
ncbi:hypothetical protein TEA_019331 [Camellia sinensis var. sinensis]|uniref:SET domain-containing protein n=1 Tax=Camellia sinensis var. sinensis TaxID=542762 RepID=A0A4S4DAN1_CAMSN|nr:hypothetical protein TEA_019331 [Camellia sinensis var. sinensis]